jgi:hypothetical protein
MEGFLRIVDLKIKLHLEHTDSYLVGALESDCYKG